MPIVGVISDTHGLLRPEIFNVFRRVDLILHAGDIGTPEILEELKKIAPTIAVRGNNDRGAWARRIPETVQTEFAGVSIFMVHDLKEMEGERGAAVVISGHSHQPYIERRGGVIYLNPGSAGPRRFKLPISVARLTIHRSRVDARLIEIKI